MNYESKTQITKELQDKINIEYAEYIAKLMVSPPEVIIESAYKKVFLLEFKGVIEILIDEYLDCNDTYYNAGYDSYEKDLHDKISCLSKLEKPLYTCYDEWLSNDYSFMDDLRMTVNDLCEEAF